MQEIADILKIYKSIKLLVKMKKRVFHFTKKTKQSFCPTQYFNNTSISSTNSHLYLSKMEI